MGPRRCRNGCANHLWVIVDARGNASYGALPVQPQESAFHGFGWGKVEKVDFGKTQPLPCPYILLTFFLQSFDFPDHGGQLFLLDKAQKNPVGRPTGFFFKRYLLFAFPICFALVEGKTQ